MVVKNKILNISEPWLPHLEHGHDTNLRKVVTVRKTEVT